LSLQARKEAQSPDDPNTALAQLVLARSLLQSKAPADHKRAHDHVLQSAAVLSRTAQLLHNKYLEPESWWSWASGKTKENAGKLPKSASNHHQHTPAIAAASCCTDCLILTASPSTNTLAGSSDAVMH
jgi:hypothetical protein